tara:strand:- start:937 stop:1236 length:300 start_codon:yes stop_codon:yes gene_type:complete
MPKNMSTVINNAISELMDRLMSRVSKEDYDWWVPFRWVDMNNDSSVLIGDEFWELIGGKGTYENFITEVSKLGQEYKERIYREFLGTEPTFNSIEDVLR